MPSNSLAVRFIFTLEPVWIICYCTLCYLYTGVVVVLVIPAPLYTGVVVVLVIPAPLYTGVVVVLVIPAPLFSYVHGQCVQVVA